MWKALIVEHIIVKDTICQEQTARNAVILLEGEFSRNFMRMVCNREKQAMCLEDLCFGNGTARHVYCDDLLL